MKKILFVLLFAFATLAQAQQGPTGLGSQTINQNWSRNGNTGNGSSPTNANIFGTAWNSPIYTITDGVVRTRLNGTWNQTINGVLQNVSGNFGIGRGGFFDTRVPVTLLHLAGTGSTNAVAGWRPWMQTGITFTSNNDLAYIGHRSTSGLDATDLMFVWSDNILRVM